MQAKVSIWAAAILGIYIWATLPESSALAASGPKCSMSEKVFDVENIRLNNPFLGGRLPEIVGFVTHEQKKFKPLVRKSAPLRSLHKKLMDTYIYLGGGEENDGGLDKARLQKYQVYLAYRRASNDISGTPFTLFECPEAKNFIFDFLHQVDGTGFFDGMRSLMEGNIRGFLRGRFAIEGVVKYKLEYWPKNALLASEADDSRNLLSGKPTKMKIPHPSAPKQLVLHALFDHDGTSPGLYDFKLTADVEYKCVGPFVICNALPIASFIGDLQKIATLGVKDAAEDFITGKILGLINDKTGDYLDLDATIKNTLTKTTKNIYRNRHQVTPFQAVIEAKDILIPVTVPDITDFHKCKTIEPLLRRGFRLAIKTVAITDVWKNQTIERTAPEKFKDVPPGGQITLYVRDAAGDGTYRCKNIRTRFQKVRKGL